MASFQRDGNNVSKIFAFNIYYTEKRGGAPRQDSHTWLSVEYGRWSRFCILFVTTLERIVYMNAISMIQEREALCRRC
jgi:hypothetical protein